jgi:hypothetical protein
VNTNELEDAIRAELRAEVRQAPAGAPTKAAVLQAVAGLPMDPGVHRLRHWSAPLLAAAAVVLLAVGLTVGARALTSSRPDHHNHPNQPINQQRITPPPPHEVQCSSAHGETLINGLQTSYTVTATGQRRYVFEYYCAGSDGHRTGSTLQVFKPVNGTLQFLAEPMRPELNNVVLSVTGGGQDGFQARDANLISSTLPYYGAVLADTYFLDGDDDNPSHLVITGGGTPVAQACRTTDLSVQVASAQQPVQHLVLQLTNRSKVVCALWGNPHYAPQIVGKQNVSYLLRGPAGGVTSAQSAPVILLQPGATAGASIGSSRPIGSCSVPTTYRITLPDGVDLGGQTFTQCDLVSYPLVPRASGVDTAEYSTVPQPSAPSPCGDGNELVLGFQSASTQSGDGAGRVLTAKLLSGPSCTFTGYPDVYARASSNNVVAIARLTPRGTLGGLAAATNTPPTVTLKVGQTASALVEWEAAAYSPTTTCNRNVRISVTLGGTTSTPNPAVSQVCDLTVHPWVAGTTGSQ